HLFSMKEKQRLVLGEFLNSEVMNFNEPAEGVVRYNMTYALDLLGSLKGRVLLNLDSSLAHAVAAILFASETGVSDEDMHVAMQELLNIFGGHLVTAFNELGHDLDIATPERSDEDFMTAQATRRILFRFSCLGRIIQFVVLLKN
ncbi:MAG TPA: chemotaxis protein CheX, partial [Turneriella sp.]|nr:chemotaxis protein CheX [Turneriella sp.]